MNKKEIKMPKFLLAFDGTEEDPEFLVLHTEFPVFLYDVENDKCNMLEDIPDNISEAEIKQQINEIVNDMKKYIEEEIDNNQEDDDNYN